MIKIINNFAELLNCKQITDKIFDKSVNLLYLNDEELLIIDKCLEKVLNMYPKLYNVIVESAENKHRYDKIERQNKKYEEIFIRYLEEKNYREASKTFSMLSNVRINKEISMKLFNDEKLADLFYILNNELSHLSTKDEVRKDIKQYLENSIGKMIADPLTLDNLSKYLVEEISLRLLVPEEYDFDDTFIDCELFLDEIEVLEKKNYLNDIRILIKEQKSSSEILETLKFKYKIGKIEN